MRQALNPQHRALAKAVSARLRWIGRYIGFGRRAFNARGIEVLHGRFGDHLA